MLIRPDPQIPRGLVMPMVCKARLQGLRIQVKVLDGPGGRPQSVLDPSPLEGRTGRAGGRHQPFGVADHDLAVGPDIDIQGQRFLLVNARPEHAGDDVSPAHIGGHLEEREQSERGPPTLRPELPGPERGNKTGHGRVRGFADKFRIQPQEQMGHNRIAGDGHMGYPVQVDPGLGL